jgi:hypothetical protein
VTSNLDAADLVAGSVAVVRAAVSDVMDAALLVAARDAEVAGQNRKTALAAIDDRLAALEVAV